MTLDRKNQIFVRPNKPVDEMTDAEIDAFADAVFDQLVAPVQAEKAEQFTKHADR